MIDSRVGDGRFGPSQWDAEHRRRKLAAAHRQRGAGPRSDPMGGRREAVPHPEPVAVPQRGTARAGQRAVGDRVQRGQEPRPSHSSTRTADQTYKARWWQSAPVLSWNEVARQLIARNDLDAADAATTPRAAEPEWGGRGDQLLERQVPLRLLAAVERDHHDVGRWECRHRRQTRRGRRSSPRRIPSGPRGTTASTPHTSPCCGCSSAMCQAASRSRASHAITGGSATRTFDTFSQPLAELIEARIWAGLHYRSADVAGQLLGGNVASYGIENYFQPAH